MQVGAPAQFLARLLAAVAALVLGSVAVAVDIEVKVVQYGTGGLLRSGGPVAAQIEFRSTLGEPIEIEAVWEVENADRDVTEFSRRVLLNPNQPLRRWLYAEMPPYPEGQMQDAIFDLRLYAVEGGVRVRDLGTAKIATSISENPPVVLGPAEDSFVLVGPRTYGLDIFTQNPGGKDRAPSMNTRTLIAKLLDAESFPDRWEGYAAFDAMVWGGGTVPPARISEESGRAILEWVERGGNLVISLPAAGDPWSIGVEGRHPLSGVLPSAAPERIEDVRVADLLPLLSLSDALRARDARTRIAAFDPAALDRSWRPFIAVPERADRSLVPSAAKDGEDALAEIDGKVIGIRCQRGFGHITVLGLDVEDLAARSLQTPSIPQGDVFWNRILGRRADTPSGAEYQQLSDAKRLAGGGYTRQIGTGETIASEIGLAGEAALGVLAAAGVFALYWLIAGPLGFAVLKAMRREKWSWVAYLGVAAVFTAVIWLVGSSMAGRSARIKHLTVLDMVERAPGEFDPLKPQLRRATSWLSLYAPKYGSTLVELDPDGGTGQRNILSSWRPFQGVPIAFPSRERYAVPLDEPGTANAPSRATSIDFHARWMGTTPAGWGEMPSVARPVSVTIDREATPSRISIKGALTHRLPGALRDVLIVHVWPVRPPLMTLDAPGQDGISTRVASGQLPSRGVVVSLGSWDPDVPLDLASTLPAASLAERRIGLERSLYEMFYQPLYRSASQLVGNFGIGESSLELRREFQMLSLYGMLHPPQYLQNPPSDPEVLAISRFGARDLDLSDFLAEPCLLVLGWLDSAKIPYPLLVDGQPVDSEGSVMVRWILPLPADIESIVPAIGPKKDAPPRSGGDGNGDA